MWTTPSSMKHEATRVGRILKVKCCYRIIPEIEQRLTGQTVSDEDNKSNLDIAAFFQGPQNTPRTWLWCILTPRTTQTSNAVGPRLLTPNSHTLTATWCSLLLRTFGRQDRRGTLWCGKEEDKLSQLLTEVSKQLPLATARS
ncbi:hypothetical protein GRJ2_002444600 [Grus japonensis]|uniref:Uncharacterized protein n=1 Tax=Grus japonensis TaxID=30415 RepID=A0ABC9XRZ1_GRUJA